MGAGNGATSPNFPHASRRARWSAAATDQSFASRPNNSSSRRRASPASPGEVVLDDGTPKNVPSSARAACAVPSSTPGPAPATGVKYPQKFARSRSDTSSATGSLQPRRTPGSKNSHIRHTWRSARHPGHSATRANGTSTSASEAPHFQHDNVCVTGIRSAHRPAVVHIARPRRERPMPESSSSGARRKVRRTTRRVHGTPLRGSVRSGQGSRRASLRADSAGAVPRRPDTHSPCRDRHHTAVMPPSITSSEPVIHADSSEARNRQPKAMSIGCPNRPAGV